MISEDQFQLAMQLINKAHNEDPTKGQPNTTGAEFSYGQRMLLLLEQYQPNSSQELKIAANCHHLRRWEIERKQFPMDKQGYFNWRRAIAKHQLNITTQLLLQSGFPEDEITKITDCLRKENIKRIADAQVIEDVACLVFLKYYLEDFAQPHPEEKVVDILCKTMQKMSPKGIEMTKTLDLSNNVNHYISKASLFLPK